MEKQSGNTAWPHLGAGSDPGHWPRSLMFLDSTEFRVEALLRAAGSTALRGSRDPSVNRWHIRTPHGCIAVSPSGAGWAGIAEVDLDGPPRDDGRRTDNHDAFFRSLRELADSNPGLMRTTTLPTEEPEERPGTPGIPGASREARHLLGALMGSTRQDHPCGVLAGLGPEDETGALAGMDEGIIMSAARRATGHDQLELTSDPVNYRYWHLRSSRGTITFWDAGNGRANLVEIDLDQAAAREFRNIVRSAPKPEEE